MEYTRRDIDDITCDIKSSKVKVKKLPKLTTEEVIVDKYLNEGCITTIRKELDLTYDEVMTILNDYGVI
tara:strand:- start:795 stop:1001 length:207 start_codon:yes stop_codon:yes gene_type:complete